MFLNASLTGREVKEVIKNPGIIWKIEKATSDGYFIIRKMINLFDRICGIYRRLPFKEIIIFLR